MCKESNFIEETPVQEQKAQMTDSPPRIALFLRTLGGGGAERVLLNLAQGFVEAGLNVDLVLSAGEGLDLWQIPPKVRVVNLDAPRVSASLPALIGYLRRERPAAIIPSLHYANEVALLAKYLSGVPTKVLIPEHNVLSREIAFHEKGSRKHLIPLAVWLLYPLADAIVAVSKGVAEDLKTLTGLPKDRIHTIYNPVILPDLLERSQEPIDHPWFKPGEPPVILGVGRLEAQKDFPTLIRAFARIRQVLPARLMIIGWGPDRPKLESLIQELGIEADVDLPGFIGNPVPYMTKASVFALSSAWEGLPTVLIEAMAVGVPVVSTNCESGPDEILNHGQYGVLVPVGDDQILADAILKVLAGQLKPVSPEWLEQFTLKSATQCYLDLLNLLQ
jgi:glycosyltransferase involved in cell wall biosynthesis